MGIKIGNLNLTSAFIGTKAVQKIYNGNTLIWQKDTIKEYSFRVVISPSAFTEDFEETLTIPFTANDVSYSSMTLAVTGAGTSDFAISLKFDNTQVANGPDDGGSWYWTNYANRVIKTGSPITGTHFPDMLMERISILSSTYGNITSLSRSTRYSGSISSIYYGDCRNTVQHNMTLPSAVEDFSGRAAYDSFSYYVSYDNGATKTLIFSGDSGDNNYTFGSNVCLSSSSIDFTKSNIRIYCSISRQENYDVIKPYQNKESYITVAGVCKKAQWSPTIINNVFSSNYSLKYYFLAINDTSKNQQHASLNRLSPTQTGDISSLRYILPFNKTYSLIIRSENFYNEDNYLYDDTDTIWSKTISYTQSNGEQDTIITTSIRASNILFAKAFSSSGTISVYDINTDTGVETLIQTTTIDSSTQTYLTLGDSTSNKHRIHSTVDFLLGVPSVSSNYFITYSCYGTKFRGDASPSSLSGTTPYPMMTLAMTQLLPGSGNVTQFGFACTGQTCAGLVMDIDKDKRYHEMNVFPRETTSYGAAKYITSTNSGYLAFLHLSTDTVTIFPDFVEGTSKTNNTYYIFTDNTTIKNHYTNTSYTRFNFYHLDGTPWS